MREVTLILQQMERGDPRAAETLFPLLYDELRKLATAKMAREPDVQTLQPTALVHEAWLRLGAEHQPSWQNRAHFFGAAAEAMRRILIDRARQHRAQRHGGDLKRVNIDDLEIAGVTEDDDVLLAIHEALEKLTLHDSRKAELVKLHYFADLTFDEVADVMGISSRTVKRDWAYARAWLFNEIKRLQA